MNKYLVTIVIIIYFIGLLVLKNEKKIQGGYYLLFKYFGAALSGLAIGYFTTEVDPLRLLLLVLMFAFAFL